VESILLLLNIIKSGLLGKYSGRIVGVSGEHSGSRREATNGVKG